MSSNRLVGRLLSGFVFFLLSGSAYASICSGERAYALSSDVLERVSEVNDEHSAQLEEISESESAFVIRRLADDQEVEFAPGYEAVVEKSSCRVVSVAQIESCDDGIHAVGKTVNPAKISRKRSVRNHGLIRPERDRSPLIS